MQRFNGEISKNDTVGQEGTYVQEDNIKKECEETGYGPEDVCVNVATDLSN